MLTRLDLRGFEGDLTVALAVPSDDDAPDVAAAVRAIVAEVREHGDDAVRGLTERFDGVVLGDLRVPPEELERALADLDPDLRAALELARDQVLAYHEAQREGGATHERRGVRVSELVVPVDRAGCYVPGGRAAYPSTVLMTAIPARVAGVPEVALCVPPGPDGLPPTETLAAAALAGVDEVFRVGGAQAIAALGIGTESIRAVDVVVGPGNAYVTEAKRQLAGTVGCDSLAGPSEVVVVADATTDPRYVAADLLAQAEHGPGGRAVLVTWDPDVVEEVDRALVTQLAAAARRTDAEATLRAGGRAVIVEHPRRALDVANALAPEHLQLMCSHADALVPSVRHAGAVFVGPWASAVFGDYVAGTNHVLPTGGTARFSGALRVSDFQKHVHVVTLDREALLDLGPYVRVLARAEGLDAHADAVRLREERR